MFGDDREKLRVWHCFGRDGIYESIGELEVIVALQEG
jgi:hypothetical protein